jgi:hypothetical protein
MKRREYAMINASDGTFLLFYTDDQSRHCGRAIACFYTEEDAFKALTKLNKKGK